MPPSLLFRASAPLRGGGLPPLHVKAVRLLLSAGVLLPPAKAVPFFAWLLLCGALLLLLPRVLLKASGFLSDPPPLFPGFLLRFPPLLFETLPRSLLPSPPAPAVPRQPVRPRSLSHPAFRRTLLPGVLLSFQIPAGHPPAGAGTFPDSPVSPSVRGSGA